MNKKQISTIAIYVVLLLVFNVIFFAIPFEKTSISWISFVFTWIAFLLGYGITYYAFSETETLQSKVYGFPVFRIGFFYMATQLVVTVILCAVGSVINVPAWVALVLSMLILTATMIGVIATDNARDVIQNMDQKTAVQTQVVKTFRLDVENLIGVCKDPVVKKKMESLADAFKYSDPVSRDSLVAIEARISDEVNVLKSLALGEDPDALVNKIDEVKILLADRNRRCKEGK